jgi:hypothetical protein
MASLSQDKIPENYAELNSCFFVIIHHGDKMKKILIPSLLIFLFTMSACIPQADATSVPVTEPAVLAATQTPIPVLPTETAQPSGQKPYTNSAFGFSFQYPASWFGPEEYISDNTLRVEVGSDKVYPYGEPPEQPSEVKNSYNVVIQYTKNNQNQYWKDTYQSLVNLKDGESFSDGRSLVIRVGQVNIGRFEGVEYISTLSDTAQTEPVYMRNVILMDNQSNLVTVMGQPINVEISNGAEWRDVYRMIDEANQVIFHDIVESITVE